MVNLFSVWLEAKITRYFLNLNNRKHGRLLAVSLRLINEVFRNGYSYIAVYRFWSSYINSFLWYWFRLKKNKKQLCHCKISFNTVFHWSHSYILSPFYSHNYIMRELSIKNASPFTLFNRLIKIGLFIIFLFVSYIIPV